MKALILATTLLSILVAGASLASAASGPAATPAASATPAWPYTLYGDALNGWGLTPSTLTRPGPTLVVTTGDALSLKLVSADGSTHNWFIDQNNNSALDTSEPHSTDITNAGPVWFNSTVTLAAGSYTYRCGFHPTSMWGELVVLAAPTFSLWGRAGGPNGWGLKNDSISYPGPTLNVTRGQTVTVDLFSADGVDHTFYVDFANTGSASGNTVSGTFNGSHAVRFSFAANLAGNFTYACGLHGQTVMKGTLHVAGTTTSPPPPPQGPDYTLYAAVILIVVIVAIVAVVVIRRRPRAPPAQPPQ